MNTTNTWLHALPLACSYDYTNAALSQTAWFTDFAKAGAKPAYSGVYFDEVCPPLLPAPTARPFPFL